MIRNAHEITSTTSSLSLRERVGVRGYKMLKLFRARSLVTVITSASPLTTIKITLYFLSNQMNSIKCLGSKTSTFKEGWFSSCSNNCFAFSNFLNSVTAYLPIQKLENIFPSKSSELICPVISDRLFCASLKSSATSSPARLVCSWVRALLTDS